MTILFNHVLILNIIFIFHLFSLVILIFYLFIQSILFTIINNNIKQIYFLYLNYLIIIFNTSLSYYINYQLYSIQIHILSFNQFKFKTLNIQISINIFIIIGMSSKSHNFYCIDHISILKYHIHSNYYNLFLTIQSLHKHSILLFVSI